MFVGRCGCGFAPGHRRPTIAAHTEADDGTRQHQRHEQDDEDYCLFLHLLFVCHYVEHYLVSLIHTDGSYLSQILDCLVHIIVHDALDR